VIIQFAAKHFCWLSCTLRSSCCFCSKGKVLILKC